MNQIYDKSSIPKFSYDKNLQARRLEMTSPEESLLPPQNFSSSGNPSNWREQAFFISKNTGWIRNVHLSTKILESQQT